MSDTQGIDAYVDLSRDAGQIASATKYYMLTQGLLKQAVTFADDGTVPPKSVVDTWKALLSQPAPDPRKDLALEDLVANWRSRADLNTKAAKGVIAMATTKAALREAAKTLIECAARLEQRLAEMRGAKR